VAVPKGGERVEAPGVDDPIGMRATVGVPAPASGTARPGRAGAAASRSAASGPGTSRSAASRSGASGSGTLGTPARGGLVGLRAVRLDPGDDPPIDPDIGGAAVQVGPFDEEHQEPVRSVAVPVDPALRISWSRIARARTRFFSRLSSYLSMVRAWAPIPWA
jgi:hypothetical protein